MLPFVIPDKKTASDDAVFLEQDTEMLSDYDSVNCGIGWRKLRVRKNM